MLKTIAISVWLMGLLAGSMFYFSTQPLPSAGSGEGKPQLEYVNLPPITSVIIRDRKIRGYVIAEFSVSIAKGKREQIKRPLELVLRDLVIKGMHANKKLDIFKLDDFDVAAFSDELREKLNEKLGEGFVDSVLVQDLNFVSKEDVRDMLMRKS
ncbi:hypothetical protein [Salaquimonas pukyongi]|uniref:hypothetical protein n=1 Tax=Salaquimonas pukyongi TaxID=2712698 RepID=UPI00096BBE20|nr:hypothetical protein [Salaquimonas pukyongi]